MCAHNGTHIDAPSHFLKDGKTVDTICLEAFIGMAYVAEHHGIVSADNALGFIEKAKALNPEAAKRILIKGAAEVSLEAAKGPAATFFLRASGESMNQSGVQNGDLLVVDRAEKPQHGDIVIAEIDGEFTVKRLLLRPRPALEPVSDSPEFRTLYPENICIFGIVTHVIHRTRELR